MCGGTQVDPVADRDEQWLARLWAQARRIAVGESAQTHAAVAQECGGVGGREHHDLWSEAGEGGREDADMGRRRGHAV